MLRGLTGTPMRRIALANNSLADAEPEPLTLANLMTKSLTDVIAEDFTGASVMVHSNSKAFGPQRTPIATLVFDLCVLCDLCGSILLFTRLSAVHHHRSPALPARCATKTSACPRRRSGNARRTGRSAGTHLRP